MAPASGVAVGVVVEDVGRDLPAVKAGLQAGDLILSWSRPPAPPADLAGGQGLIDSAFDLEDVEVEQVPRAPVTLRGRHGEAEVQWTLPPTESGLAVRPQLEAGVLAVYQAGKDLIRSKKTTEGVERWRAAAALAKGNGQQIHAVWLLAKAAKALADARLWTEADAVQEELIQEAVASAPPSTVAQLLRARGLTHYQRSDWARAEEWFRRALATDLRLGSDRLAVAFDVHLLALMAWQRGDVEGADRHIRRALGMRERLAPESQFLASTLNNAGIFLQHRGDFAGAEAHHRRALAIRKKLLPDSLALAGSLSNLTTLSLKRGDIARAEEYERAALAIRERLAPESLLTAYSLNNLGNVASAREDLAAADEYLRRALAMKERLFPNDASLPETLESLGLVAEQRGDFAAAESYYRRALAVTEKVFPDSFHAGIDLRLLGMAAGRRGDLEAAREHCQRALAVLERLVPNSIHVAVTLRSLGEIAKDRGDLPAAEAHCRKALAMLEKIAPGSLDQARALHTLGLVQRRAGRGAFAAESFLAALDVLEQQKAKLGGTDEHRSGFAARYTGYYHEALDTLIDLGRPAEALQVLERSRARSLLALLAERDLLFAADLPEELGRRRKETDAEYDRVQRELAPLDPAKKGVEVEKLLGRLRELRREQEAIAASIRQASPRFAALHYPQPLDLAGVRSVLDPGTVFVAYAVGAEKTVVFVVRGLPPGATTRAAGLSVLRIPAGERTLREKVESFRSALRGRDVDGRARLETQAAELYDLLVRPVAPQIASGVRLLLSVDGPLHSLPFGALVRREPGHRADTRRGSYLIEWKPLHTITSATLYAELKKSRQGEGPRSRPLVAFGDPRYPALGPDQTAHAGDAEVRTMATRGFAFTPLPATRREVEDVARLFPGRVQKYLGEEATEERAKTSVSGARYLHFACHGYLDERFPLNSGLALTIPDRPAEEQDNGLLQAWEIFDQVRIDAELVTLSACDTGLGKETGGEGLLGLTRAFHYAGARSVLASLWSVADESTALLMKRFYGHLQAGRSRDEALRLAQLDLIRTRSAAKGGRPGDLSHPFHWAAFQLSGDWK